MGIHTDRLGFRKINDESLIGRGRDSALINIANIVSLLKGKATTGDTHPEDCQ